MTVSSSLAYKSYAGNGVTTAFATTFQFFDNTDLSVSLFNTSTGVETAQTLTTHYTVSGGDGATGTVTMLTAPATGTTLILRRVVPYTQAVDYISNDSFPAETHEEALDKLTMLVQQAYGLVLSTPVLPSSFDPNTTARPILPLPVSGKLLSGKSDASGWENVTVASLSVSGIPTLIASAAEGDLLMYNASGGVWVDATTLTGAYTLSGAVSVSGSLAISNPAVTLGSLKAFMTPGHRLSLTAAVPVTTTDVTAATTIRWTPHKHNLTPIYNGSAWINAAVAELSFILDSTNHLSGKNYDFFLDYNSGTPRIVTGPAWTSDTGRADALGVDATYGYVVNNASMTCRISNNGGSFSLGAKAGLYLGTIRCSANGQTEDSGTGTPKRFVWNMYNRVLRPMERRDTTNTWNYSSAANFQQANANAANQLAFVRGLDEDMVQALVLGAASTSGVGRRVALGIGVGSSTVNSSINVPIDVDNSTAKHGAAHYVGLPGLGYREMRWLEIGAGVDTQTWVGDLGTTYLQTGIVGGVMA